MEYNKILFSRLISSFLWTVVLQAFPLSFYILLTNFNIKHPVEWLLKPVSVAFSFSTWLSLIPIHSLVFAIGYILAQDHQKLPCICKTRFQFFCNLFTKINFLKLFFYFLIGLIVPWSYLNINKLTLFVNCQQFPDKFCLSDGKIYLISCGCWTGVYYFLRYDLLIEKRLEYPIIRQIKFLQIRYKFLSIFFSSLTSSLVPIFYYSAFYLCYGKHIIWLFEVFFSAQVDSSTVTNTSLLSVSQLVHLWTITTCVILILRVLNLMIQIHYTEHYSFALIKQPNVDSIILSAALSERNMPIIQHLACYDLYIMSMSPRSNRWQIFTLSQPGGHPHTWNAILNECIKLIEEFILKIEDIYKVKTPVKPPPIVPKHIHPRSMNVRYEEILTSPVPLSPINKLRNLVEEPGMPFIHEERSILDDFWIKIGHVNEMIKKNSIINYMFNSKPDVEIRFILSNSQPLIWVVQSLSELSANALYEDQFGIVLKDLPLIISALLRLKFSVDKIGNLQNKFQRRDTDLCMKSSLKSAIRRSLYRIAVAYSDYLPDLPLSVENLNCMKNFGNFKEN